MRLQLESGYKQIFVTRFEDLVQTPGASIQRTARWKFTAYRRISEALGMPIAFEEEVSKVDKAAKRHGKAKNRSRSVKFSVKS